MVVAIIALLAALLLPALSAARDKAKSAACQSNLKQLGIAFSLYWSDYNDTFPRGYTDENGKYYLWIDRVYPYLTDWRRPPSDVYIYAGNILRVLICPATTLKPPIHPMIQYGYNCLGLGTFDTVNPGYLIDPRVPQITHPTERLMIGETSDEAYLSGGAYNCGPQNIYGRHRGFANVLFVDVHVAPTDAGRLNAAAAAMWTSEPFNYWNAP